MTFRERLRAWYAPSDEKRRRQVRLETIAVLVFALGATIAGRCCTADYSERTPVATMVWWAAFLARTLEFHVALLVGIVALLCLREKLYRLAALCVPFLAFGLGADLVALLTPRGAPAVTAGTPRTAVTAGTPRTPGGTHTLRVVSANLLMVNKDKEGIVGEIVSTRPDLLLVQELTDAWQTEIDKAVKSWLPHSSFVTRDDSFGIGIWSSRPFVGEPQRYLRLGTTRTPQQLAQIDLEGLPVAVYNIHLLPPRTVEYVQGHCREMRDLADLLARETRTTLIGGDFNFTERTPQAGTLAALGFVDAQDQGGTGRGATWPVIGPLRYTFPGIRLDHIYLKGSLACRTLTTGIGRGSDHRPLIAELVVKR